MLRWLVDFSLRFRGVVIALGLVVLGYGIYTASRSQLDVFPEFAPPQVVIQTEAPGLSPEQVEQLVTRPIETAVNGVAHLESIRSQSIQGLSIITAVFAEGTDVFQARQMVSERLVEVASRIPQRAGPPTMAPLTSATSDVLQVGLTSEKRSLMEIRTFADWTLRPRLLAVPGVAKIVVFGGEVLQLQIQVRPDRLLQFGISIDDVLDSARRATGVRGAGFVDTPNQRVVFRTEGQQLSPQQLGDVVLRHKDGRSVRLKDVATIAERPEPMIGAAAIQGTPGAVLVVSSQYGANTLEVTRAVEAALEEMEPAARSLEITIHPKLFRPANFVETAIGNIRSSLLIGAVLVTIVLFFFLADVRTALISMMAIPLSLLGAIIVLNRFGVSLNTLTLGGLAIAIGEVVDDAIIDVENILRRLRDNHLRPDPRPVFQVGFDASLEVRSAVVYATFAVALVFLPEFREGYFIVHMSAVPGTSLEQSLAVGRELTKELDENPHIRSIAQRAGRAEQADDTLGTHYSEINVDLVPLSGEEPESVQSEIRAALVKFPGVYF